MNFVKGIIKYEVEDQIQNQIGFFFKIIISSKDNEDASLGKLLVCLEKFEKKDNLIHIW